MDWNPIFLGAAAWFFRFGITVAEYYHQGENE